MRPENSLNLGAGAGEFNSLPRPATTEDIHKAIKEGRWRGTESVRGALGVLFEMKHVEQFNFGPLSLDTIRSTQVEAMDFIRHGLLQLPFPECVFRCSVQFDNRSVGFHLFCVSRTSMLAGECSDGRIAVLGSIHSDKNVLTFRADHMMKVFLHAQGQAVEVNVPNEELKFWEPHVGPIGKGPFIDQGNGAVLTEGALIVMGLIMILNTKGVLKERSEPPAKPNKVRAARGIPLIPYTTRVYTSVYNDAVREGAQGTHASPRPHRRRAHVRKIAANGHHPEYFVPIDAMLINWDGEPLKARREYTVK